MKTDQLFDDYKDHVALSEGHYEYLIDKEDFKAALIEFAKFHVERALEAALEKAIIEEDPSDYGTGYAWINEKSILKSYSLENIK